MPKRWVVWGSVGILWATGCVGISSPFAAGEYVESDYQASVKPMDARSEVIYRVLSAEIAGQRGQYDVALSNYMDVLHVSPDAWVAERATQVALYVKDASKALEAALLWMAREPKSLPAHRITVMLQIKADHLDDAARAFGQLVSLPDPDLETTLIELVKWMDSELSRDQALHALSFLRDRFPKVAELHYATALLASNIRENDLALAEVRQALSLRPRWSRASLLESQLVAQKGDLKAAKETLGRALKADPNNQRLRLVYAQLLAKSGDIKGSERELQRIVDKEPENQDARFALASIWLETGQLERARFAMMGLMSDRRWQDQVNFSLGLIDARRSLYDSALHYFDAVQPGPLALDAQLNAASALISLGRQADARLRLAAVRKSFPDEALRLYVLEAEMLEKSKEYAAAFEVLNSAISEQPEQLDLLYSRAMLAERLGQMDVMQADLRAVLAKRPDDPAVLNALGFSLADHQVGDLSEAESLIKRAMERRPGDPAIMDSYGWVLYRKGNRAESLIYLRKAYALFNDPEISAHLGEVLWENGSHAEAVKVWREGYRKNPDQDDMVRVKEKYPEGFKGITK
jgi:tetratricopeptide (TPR) repeat protein